MDPDLSAFVEEINAGAPVPKVDPQDLGAALQFFGDLRAHHIGNTSQKRGPAFFSSELGQRCTPGANILAVTMRAQVLQRLLESEPSSSTGPTTARHRTIVHRMATLSFTVAQLMDLDAVRKRVLDAAELSSPS